MLSESERELIAAAVDGILAPAGDASFRLLIADSSEAVILFQQLQLNSARLKSAPRYAAPASLAPQVLNRVANLPRPVPTTVGRQPLAVRGRPNLVPYGLAAAVLLSVASASFWYAWDDARKSEVYAQRERLPNPIEPPPSQPVPARTLPSEPPIQVLPPAVPSAGPVEVAVLPTPPEAAPTPRTFGSDGLVASPPLTDVKPFESVQLRLPLLLSMSELEKEDARSKLRDELSRDPAYRIDLFTRDAAKAVDVFQTVCKVAGVHLAIDAVAKDRMAKKLPSSWVIYSEVLTADELAQLVLQLSKATERPIATAHVIPAQQAEQRDLRDLLGVDPGLWKRPKTAPKPISANTGDQIVANLLKGKTVEKPALLMTYSPANARSVAATSKEIKSFLERREERKPNAVPVMIVIRMSN